MEYSDNDSPELTKWKLNHENALGRHHWFFAQQTTLAESVLSFGLEAIRTSALINGGAAIAVFAFLGSLYGSENGAAASIIRSLHPAAMFFAAGALLSGMASGWAYFAQSNYMSAHDEAELHWQQPYIRHGEAAERAERFGRFWHAMCVAFIVASYSASALGLWNAWQAMTLAH